MTGRLILRDNSAGTKSIWLPLILLPNPPPQYSLIRTTSSMSKPSRPATARRVCTKLCVDACMKSLPFCQYDIEERGSNGWCESDW